MARIEGGQSVYFMALQNQLKLMQLAMQGQMTQLQQQQSLKSYMDVHWPPAPLPTLVSPFREWWADKVQKCPHSTILLKDLHVALDRARLYSKSMTMAFAGSLVEFELGLKWTGCTGRLGCRYGQWKLPGYKLV